VTKWIVGIDNPHSSDPGTALSPSGNGASAGGRLFEMSGMSLKDYLAAFKRVNFIDCPFFSKGDVVVVLGKTVWGGLGLPSTTRWWTSSDRQGVKYILVPHPSGKSLAYNDSNNRAALQTLLWRLASEEGEGR